MVVAAAVIVFVWAFFFGFLAYKLKPKSQKKVHTNTHRGFVRLKQNK
jgi:hypothetical protein